MLIEYPLNAVKGDLKIIDGDDSNDAALTRARILTDVVIGERKFYPEFGVDFHLFSPDNQNSDLEALQLANSLNFYCRKPENSYSYSVVNRVNPQDNTIIFDIFINKND